MGQGQLDLELTAPATAGDVLRRLFLEYPSLERYGPHLMLAVNAAYVDRDYLLREGDEVALIPPVSGGAAQSSVFQTRSAHVSHHP